MIIYIVSSVSHCQGSWVKQPFKQGIYSHNNKVGAFFIKYFFNYIYFVLMHYFQGF